MSLDSKNSNNTKSANLYNGANCGSYSWAQTYKDIEITVNVDAAFPLCKKNFRVDLDRNGIQIFYYPRTTTSAGHCQWMTLLQGEFSHSVDIDSCFWILDNKTKNLIIFFDKTDSLWWSNLIQNEQTKIIGTRDLCISANELTDSDRGVCNELILEQMEKLRINSGSQRAR